MLDYIKNQVNIRMASMPNISKKNEDVDIPNDVITEYAHIFQELDELSIEGTDVGKERKMAIDIPVEDDDIELQTIEFNIGDGRVTDVPGDATVQEQYKTMKTFDMFYKESAEHIQRMPRESDTMYKKRVSNEASKLYEEYCENVAIQNDFGFDDIKITNECVPSKLNIDFGPIGNDSNKSFMTKVNAYFATDKKHNINKKQLDSINLVRNGAFAKIGEPLMAYMESKYDIPTGANVWDIATPTNLYVPRGNGDSFCVVLEFMNELTNKKEYFGWTRSVRPFVEKNGIYAPDTDIDTAEAINMESFVTETHYENHANVSEEELRREERQKQIRRKSISRFYQEAIDFGGGADGGSDLPPVEDSDNTNDSSDTSNADTDIDNSSDDTSSDDISTDTDDNKEEATVNDVSKDIASKVSQQTKKDVNETKGIDNDGDDASVTFDDDDSSSDDNTDTDENSDVSDTTIDDQLDELDNSGETESDAIDSSEDGFSEDDMNADKEEIDNLTIDQLMERGSDKIKKMTLSEIKSFLNSGSEDAIQEAFILTKKNINKELDISIRKCLGVLNDNKMDLKKLLKKFRFVAKGLNRTVTKAIKMSDVYSTEEIGQMQKLNTSLVTLLTSLKKYNDPNYITAIKTNIRDFVENSKIVGKFIEDKLSGKSVTQEAYIQEGVFLSEKNVKKRLGNKISPVHSDLSEIVKVSDAGKLNKGKLVRMYKPKNRTRSDSYNVTDDYTTSTQRTYEVSTVQSNNIDSLIKILNKILRKPKVQNAFSSSDMKNIEELCDKLDSFIDFVESILFDDGDKESLLIQVGKDAKELVELLEKVYEACNDNNQIKSSIKKHEVSDFDDDEENDEISSSSESHESSSDFDFDLDIDEEDNDEDNDVDYLESDDTDEDNDDDKSKENKKDEDDDEEEEDE